MIAIERRVIRTFCALLRKCVVGRPREPAPCVVMEVVHGRLTMVAKTDSAILVYSTNTRCHDTSLMVPIVVLKHVEGSSDDFVEFVMNTKFNGETRFTYHGVAKVYPFDTKDLQKPPPIPALPNKWHAVSAEFFTALHECGKTTAKDAIRYALTHVQLRGSTGQVIATDGHTALIYDGFTFPFTEELLIPALPLFGSRELFDVRDVRVGSTAKHVVVEAGPWQLFLNIDQHGRYPNVVEVVPKAPSTFVELDARDASKLLDQLTRIPESRTDCVPITFDIGNEIIIRFQNAKTEMMEEYRLERSSFTGTPTLVVMDRQVVARALTLRCLTMRITTDKPIVFVGDTKTLISLPLDVSLAIQPDKPISNIPERRIAVRNETNGHPPNPGDTIELLAVAEELRSALVDATAKATQLISALKSRKKERKVLTQVWSSLKALNLGSGDQP